MAFPFNPAQLLAASTQPSTPVKSEDASTPASLPETMRYLAANGPLFQGLPGLPGGFQIPASLPPGFPLQMPFPGGPLDIGGGGAGGPMPIFFDPMGYHQFNGERRKNATRETTAPLKSWLQEHKKNPYPTKQEKILLAVVTKMSMTQVSTWFANARRRLKKEHKNEWSPRNRPQDDDDDLDMVDVNERPSSSTSDLSTSGVLPQQNGKRTHESNNNANGSMAPLGSPSSAETESAEAQSPKKPKIWSIADISMKKEEEGDSREENGCSEEAGSSKKEAEESPLTGLGAMGNPFLMQQYMAMMQRLGSVPGAGILPFPRPPMAGPAFPPLAIFNSMLFLQQMQQQAAVAAQQQASPQQTTVSQLNGSWSEGQSPSPSSSNHSAASPPEEKRARLG